jgi:hypothetical protein
LYRLSPKTPNQARRLYDTDKEVEAGTGGEWIADGSCVGDNVAVWVVKAIHVVQEAFIDPDRNTNVPGDVVFSGL